LCVALRVEFLFKLKVGIYLCFIIKPILGNRYGPGVIPYVTDSKKGSGGAEKALRPNKFVAAK